MPGDVCYSIGMKVDCYYNLHKHCISIRHKGLVIAHAHSVELNDVKFVVSQAGRARVLKEKRKNVHAFVRGELVRHSETPDSEVREGNVTYNPYKYDSFVRRADKSSITGAQKVYISGRSVCAVE